jgi:urease accessory protein
MLIFNQLLDALAPDQTVSGQLTLPFEVRQKGRMKVVSDDGVEVGVQLARGKVLRDGQFIQTQDGIVYQVFAQAEQVSTVHCETAHDLARICYHLGNRHVPLQVEATWCRYLHDHVLDDMVSQLGGKVEYSEAVFEPESGAYHSSGDSGGHAHSHDHSHSHSH